MLPVPAFPIVFCAFVPEPKVLIVPALVAIVALLLDEIVVAPAIEPVPMMPSLFRLSAGPPTTKFSIDTAARPLEGDALKIEPAELLVVLIVPDVVMFVWPAIILEEFVRGLVV